jgi:hypothetical protein
MSRKIHFEEQEDSSWEPITSHCLFQSLRTPLPARNPMRTEMTGLGGVSDRFSNVTQTSHAQASIKNASSRACALAFHLFLLRPFVTIATATTITMSRTP